MYHIYIYIYIYVCVYIHIYIYIYNTHIYEDPHRLRPNGRVDPAALLAEDVRGLV